MTESDVQLPLIAAAAPLVAAIKPFVVFEVPGDVHAWERPGAKILYTAAGHPYIHWFVHSDESRYREQIQWAAKVAMRGRAPTGKPVALLVHVFVRIPESWHWRKKQDARSGRVLPDVKPDWDNLGKVASDAIKEIVWCDDACVCDGRVIKRYSDRPALRVEVREMVPPGED